jgi:acyl-CoA reductase-like NAD-dependent aldehyde dehydrogenase
MKQSLIAVVILIAALFSMTGCGNKSKVDTGKLESAFSSAEAAVKAEIDKAVQAIKAEDLAGALTQLQKTYARAKLTEEQKQAIKEMVETLQKLIAEGATKSVEKAAGETTKALQDLQKK